jgi:pimeloyl-ACP methyl ester carboxylesterase
MSRIEIGGVHVEYHEQGTGEPVVLLHSSGASGGQWRALAERLSARYRVIAPDLYGYGATAHWPGRGVFSLAHEAQIVHAMLGRAGEPAHLVGHSYGGAVALHVARLRSDLLRSLTVIEPVAFHLLSDRSEIIAVAEAVTRAVACGDYSGGFGTFVDYWSGPGSWDATPAAKRDAMAARLAKVALDFHATLNEPARLEDFGDLPLSTLVLQGACSPLPTRRICELLARVLPDSQLMKIEGAGHMAPLTHRDSVNALIAAHIEVNSGRLSRRPEARQAFPGTGVSCAAGAAA